MENVGHVRQNRVFHIHCLLMSIFSSSFPTASLGEYSPILFPMVSRSKPFLCEMMESKRGNVTSLSQNSSVVLNKKSKANTLDPPSRSPHSVR